MAAETANSEVTAILSFAFGMAFLP